MLFQGKLDRDFNVMSFCCKDGAPTIAVKLEKDPAETIKNYIARKNEILKDCNNKYHDACAACNVFMEKEWPQKDKFQIEHIVYGVTPAPCQARCIYCSQSVQTGTRRGYNPELDDAQHELVFDTLAYLKENDLLSPNIRWDIASGEITVHPYRQRIYDIVGNSNADWLTNCFLFDENIAKNLNANMYSNLLFSIDAGRSNTWHKIKGVDNFEKIKKNVIDYTKAARHKEQIVLKYLIIPEINTDFNELFAFVEFVIQAGVKRVVISKDRWGEKTEEALTAAAFLITVLVQNGISPTFSFFTASEIEEVGKISKTLFTQIYGGQNQ